MTTWKGQEFEREWHRAMLEWIEGGRVGEMPTYEFFGRYNWVEANVAPWIESTEYRWKPKPKRTVTINGKVLVAPEVDAPAEGTRYLIITHKGVQCCTWTGDWSDRDTLKDGEVFLTREDAQAMADWLVKCRRGDT